MKNSSRWLSALLAIVLCLCMAPVHAYAAETETSESPKNYYEAQLTEEQQLFYTALEEHYIGADGLPQTVEAQIDVKLNETGRYKSLEELEEGVAAIANEVLHSYMAFHFDYPQVFWIDGFRYGCSYSTDSNATYQINSFIIEFINEIELTEEELLEYNEGIREATEEIREALPEKAEEYDCYKAVHTWVCDNLSYNYDAVEAPSEHLEAYTSYPVFGKNGDSLVVCEGYGETYKILCDQMELKDDVDLECVLIMGVGITANGQENHLWNAVLMPDSNWYGIDTTWDDQNETIYNYFLCGKTTLGLTGHDFENDHIENEQISSMVSVKYPEIARYGYGVEKIYDWKYKDGVLKINGEGDLPNYLAAEGAPWYEYRDEITSVIIGNGITSVPEGLLRYYQSIENLSIPFVGGNPDSDGNYDGVLGYIFGTNSTESGVPQFFMVEDGYFKGVYYAVPDSLKSVKVTNDTTIPFGAFSNCAGMSIQLNCAVDFIGEHAFYAADNATIYGFDNQYVENYCDNYSYITPIQYIDLDANQIDYIEINDGEVFQVFIGDKIDLSKLLLKIYYANGRCEEATSHIIFGECDFTTAGEKVVTVTYGEVQTTLQVVVSYKSGDLNGDGCISAKDLVRMKRILAQQTEDTFATPDLNDSGETDLEDILMLKRFLIGILSNFAEK